SCPRRISITLLPPTLGGSCFRSQQVVIELANRLDRLLELLVIGQPAANLSNALATHAQLPRASTRIRNRQNKNLVPFAARALQTTALMSNNALQQRAAQQLAG